MCELNDNEIIRLKKPNHNFGDMPQEMTAEERANWYCRLLHHLFPKYTSKGKAHVANFCDIAQYTAVLGDRALFEKLFRDWDEHYFSPCYKAFRADSTAATTTTTAPAHDNKMSSILLHFLVRECGFLKVPGITFFGGDGDAFIPTVRNGMIFKDGLSNVHGEYSHAIQWCIIGWARKTGIITLNSVDSVVKVYQSLVSGNYMSEKKIFREFDPIREVAIWDIVCDTINPNSSEQLELTGKNIYSISYRSPAYLTQKMLRYSSINECCVSSVLSDRYAHEKRNWFDKEKQVIFASPNKEGVNQVTLQKIESKNGNREKKKTIDKVGKVAYFPSYFEKPNKKRDNVMSPNGNSPAVPNEDKWKNWDAILARASEPGDSDDSATSTAATATTPSNTGGAAEVRKQ